MRSFITFLVALSLALTTHAQEAASIGGFVRDAETGETLLQANVLLLGTGLGAATNMSGYYILPDVPPGSYTVRSTYIGYQPFVEEVEVEPGEDLRLDIALEPAQVEVEEITVSADREEAEEAQALGIEQVEAARIREIPTAFEPDLFRALQLLPGVKAASDYSSGLYIRGGSPDQTLILLDRTTVYNPTHFFGFFSTFNPDAIKDVRLYKGAYPAEYGGRLGSVVDIYNKDGNRRQLDGTASVGLLASRFLVEGPYSRGSWMFAARRSTLEPLLAALNGAGVEGIPDGFYFYDLNGKVNWDLSPDDRLSLAFYAGRDALDLSLFDDAATIDLVYGNQTISGTYQHIFSNTAFANLTVTGSRYGSTPIFAFANTEFSSDIQIRDLSAKGDIEYLPNREHRLKVGVEGGRFGFNFTRSFDEEANFQPEIASYYADAFVEERWRPSSLWTIRAGLRASYFSAGEHFRLAPRLTMEYRPTADLRLQLGYGRYNQFLTLVSQGGFSGFDFWLTTGEGVAPSYGDQFVAGIKTQLPASFSVDLEGYYRTMRDLFEQDPFLSDPAGLDYADIFLVGEGYAYGVESKLERTEGRLNGFLSYTFGVTRRRFPLLNEGDYYAPKYDRTHDLNVVLNYDISRAWRLTSVFNYATGQAYTEPTAQYAVGGGPFQSSSRDLLLAPFNNRRLPPYHRLDIGATRRGRFFGVADYELQLQLLNVYSRENVWFYDFQFDADQAVERVSVPQIPVPIPNISLTLDF